MIKELSYLQVTSQ